MEVAELPSAMAVRDSKDPQGGHVVVNATAWNAFVAEIKGGHLA